MAKAGKFLVIIGVFIGIGAALLFLGSQAITSDIIIQEGQIDDEHQLEIQAKLESHHYSRIQPQLFLESSVLMVLLLLVWLRLI